MILFSLSNQVCCSSIFFKLIPYKVFSSVVYCCRATLSGLKQEAFTTAHSGSSIWKWVKHLRVGQASESESSIWLSCMVLAQALPWPCSQDVSRGRSYLASLEFQDNSSLTWLWKEYPILHHVTFHRVLWVSSWHSSNPREKDRSGKVFCNRASEVTTSLLPCSLGHTDLT